MTTPALSKIIISSEAASSAIAKKVTKAWPNVDTIIVDDPARHDRKFDMDDDPISSGKQTLVLAPNKGRFIRKCPGTMGLVCCNYYVIDLAEGCSIDCSYCILQGYLTDRRIRLATNIDDLEKQIDETLADTGRPIRLGTGELSDSLMFDNELGLARILIDLIRERPQATLELKTKTDNIQNILDIDPAPNVVIGWSLNTPEVIARDERGSANLDKRLLAAKKVVDAGWKVAFHFDPLVIHPGWKEGYRDVVDRLFSAAGPDKIAWISMGALRFHPSLKPIIKSRFGQSDLLKSQFVLCPDNKMRYVKPLRKELLAHLKSLIQSRAPTVPLYLCMEGIEMWSGVLGGSPASLGMLDEVFG
ncbi:hypothetical protein MNBD_NITROSPINAE04-2018 [hydrothermal vent metagenome]|uniref:Spore photoproduct lyase n=1 Tax=hydrothermal vent metagenome TaxID=652676 RepID=A0A3B1CHT2_9ZZZZ